MRIEEQTFRMALPSDVDEKSRRLMLEKITPEFKWDALVDFASRERLAPLLSRRLPEIGLAALIPPRQQEQLRQAYVEAAAYEILRTQALTELLAELRRVRAKPVLLKGVALAGTLYPTLGTRPMGDIDLLARRSEISRIVETLEGLGYRPAQSYRPTVFFPKLRTHSFIRERAGQPATIVEPHVSFDQAGIYRVDYQALIDSAERHPLHDHGWMLPRVAALLYAAIHLQKHVSRGYFLIWILDFHEMLTQWRPDWDEVLSLAGRWRCKTALWCSLELARGTFGTPIPPELLGRLRPGPLTRGVLRRFENLDAREKESFAYQRTRLISHLLLGTDTAAQRIRYLAYLAVREVEARASSALGRRSS